MILRQTCVKKKLIIVSRTLREVTYREKFYLSTITQVFIECLFEAKVGGDIFALKH